jgi:hypothetical protein
VARLTGDGRGPAKGRARSGGLWRSRRGADRDGGDRRRASRVRRRSGSSAARALACSQR